MPADAALDRRLWLAAGLCLAVTALCLSVPPLLWHEDAVQYLSLGESLARGRGYVSATHGFDDLLQPPLYPALLAAGTLLLGTPLRAAFLICGAAPLLTLWGLLRLHRKVFGTMGLGWTALIAAVCVMQAWTSALILEPLCLCLLAHTAATAVGAAQRRSPRRALLAGLLCAAAVLTRSEAVLSAAGLGLMLLLWPASAGAWPRRMALPLAFALGLLAVLTPYGLWMRGRLGYFEVLPKVRYNLPVGDIARHMAWTPAEAAMGAQSRDLRIMYALMPDHATFVLNHAFRHPGFDPRPLYPRLPAGPAARSLRERVRPFVDMARRAMREVGIAQPLAVLLLSLGLWRALRPGGSAGSAPLPLAAATLILLAGLHLLPALSSAEDFNPRYLLPSLLYTLPLCGYGAAVAGAALGRWLPRPAGLAPALLALALLLTYGLPTLHQVRRMGGGAAGKARRAAVDRLCQRLLPEGARVLSDQSRYAFLRHGYAAFLPSTRSLAELRDYVAAHHLEYGIFDPRTLEDDPSPINQALAAPAGWPPGWVALGAASPEKDPIWLVRLR